MGMDYNLRFAVGVPLWDLANEPQSRHSFVTRYKEDTGDAYKKEVREHFFTLLNGKEFVLLSGRWNNAPVEELRAYLKEFGLEFFYSNDIFDGFVGETIQEGESTCGGNALCEEMPPVEAIGSAIIRVKEKFQKFMPEKASEVKACAVLQVSC